MVLEKIEEKTRKLPLAERIRVSIERLNGKLKENDRVYIKATLKDAASRLVELAAVGKE